MFDKLKEVPAPRIMTIIIDGQRFPIRFTLDAMHDLEQNLSVPVFEYAQKLINKSWPGVGLADSAKVLWAGCAHMGRYAPTPDECFNAIVQEGAETAVPKLLLPLTIYAQGAREEPEEEGEGDEADSEKKP